MVGGEADTVTLGEPEASRIDVTGSAIFGSAMAIEDERAGAAGCLSLYAEFAVVRGTGDE